ncbi:MAG: hypothetical protein ACPG4M_00685 [Alphaproteobacteria bacterium]
MKKHILFPMVAGALFAGQLAFGDRIETIDSYATNQVIINMTTDSAMVLTQRDVDPAMFGTIADLWDLELEGDDGEVASSTFVTAFRQRDLLILKEVNGDKKVTIDFSAEHAYVDTGANMVETYADIELIDTDEPLVAS